MKGGDISNGFAPRFWFVFENLIADLPPLRIAKERAYCRLHRWKRAVDCWEPNQHMKQVIWRATVRFDFRIDVITWHPEGFAEELLDWFDFWAYPISHVRSSTPQALINDLKINPDVAGVFDPDSTHSLSYGRHGRIVTNPDSFQTNDLF